MSQTESPDAMLGEKLERFAMLRDTIQGLETERAELGAEIKAVMLQGARVECELYRARLQTSHKVTYPVDRFREVYGDAATLEVLQVMNKRVRELVEAGDLDGQHLEATLPGGRASRAVLGSEDKVSAGLGLS
ncbi:hypothetical protein DESA109040_14120 [Deinococcus saxicola]|uniref:hypothetical protein n=1 Tax=Deinococcus saxicola TaxID=249406 RepID=UPI0039EF8A66